MKMDWLILHALRCLRSFPLNLSSKASIIQKSLRQMYMDGDSLPLLGFTCAVMNREQRSSTLQAALKLLHRQLSSSLIVIVILISIAPLE